MATTASMYVDKAISIVEGSRYQMGISEFVTLFFDHWAYMQTGLYPPSSAIPEELEHIARELSHILSLGIKAFPSSDVIGCFLSRCQFHKKGTNFYASSPCVGKLLSRLMGASIERPTDFYEPCCGTGVNTILWIQELLESGYKSELGKVTITLEDIDALMVKACLMQLLIYLDSVKVTPGKITITRIDTIRRKTFGLVYIAERKS